MHMLNLRTLCLSLLIAMPAVAGAADKVYAPSQCVTDLEDLNAFIEANDAGAADALADHGPAIRLAYAKAHQDAGQAADVKTCGKLLHGYARSWRPGHIAVAPTPGNEAKEDGQRSSSPGPEGKDAKPAVDPMAPRYRVLGRNTILFAIPTFNDRYAAMLKQLVADHRAELASHTNWIVDVRSNGGGSDVTYAPLMGWLLDGDLRGFRTEYFVTPANLKAQEEICAQTSDPAHCRGTMDPILAKMRTAPAGSYVQAGTGRIEYEKVRLETKRPARVAVMTDRDCGSSCEQFVLEARTSYRVKVIGRPTHGSLDVSNLRPHLLPSGRAQLYYATTRTTRLPEMRIDAIGIAPDILLPKPADEAGREAEIGQVQRWLEGGAL
ncbi:MAG: S41 family peptidase [Telluria sp.]